MSCRAFAGGCIYHKLLAISASWSLVYLLLSSALFFGRFFSLFNGYQDTAKANAVVSIIYTYTLGINTVFVLSGIYNFSRF